MKDQYPFEGSLPGRIALTLVSNTDLICHLRFFQPPAPGCAANTRDLTPCGPGLHLGLCHSARDFHSLCMTQINGWLQLLGSESTTVLVLMPHFPMWSDWVTEGSWGRCTPVQHRTPMIGIFGSRIPHQSDWNFLSNNFLPCLYYALTSFSPFSTFLPPPQFPHSCFTQSVSWTFNPN